MKRICLLGLLLALCLCLCSCKSSDYKNAVAQMEAGEYQQARSVFSELADYQDAAELVRKCDYHIALDLMDEENYQEASELFLTLGEYEDSAEQVKECTYQYAISLAKKGEELEAMNLFVSIADYKDSIDKGVSCICTLAKDDADKGQLKEAVSVLSNFLDYPQVESAFCTIMLDELVNNYMPNVQEAIDSWNAYLLIWLKEFQAVSEKTPIGASITPPKVDQSAPQVVALRRSMEKANKSIAKIQEAYSDEIMAMCAEDIQALRNTVFESAKIIDERFVDLDNWAVTTLFYALQNKNASKANSGIINALYSIEDAIEVVKDNRK